MTAYIQQNFNKIQHKIVQLLKDFSIQKPALLIKGFLKVWDANMKLESKDGRLANQQNQVCEKVIQLILSLQVPSHTVIAAVVEYAKEK